MRHCYHGKNSNYWHVGKYVNLHVSLGNANQELMNRDVQIQVLGRWEYSTWKQCSCYTRISQQQNVTHTITIRNAAPKYAKQKPGFFSSPCTYVKTLAIWLQLNKGKSHILSLMRESLHLDLIIITSKLNSCFLYNNANLVVASKLLYLPTESFQIQETCCHEHMSLASHDTHVSWICVYMYNKLWIRSMHPDLTENEPPRICNLKAMPLLYKYMRTAECETYNHNARRSTKICEAKKKFLPSPCTCVKLLQSNCIQKSKRKSCF